MAAHRSSLSVLLTFIVNLHSTRWMVKLRVCLCEWVYWNRLRYSMDETYIHSLVSYTVLIRKIRSVQIQSAHGEKQNIFCVRVRVCVWTFFVLVVQSFRRLLLFLWMFACAWHRRRIFYVGCFARATNSSAFNAHTSIIELQRFRDRERDEEE